MNIQPWPNHALQRTAPRVTARAFCERSGIYICGVSVRSTVWHAPRHAPPSLSLGSLGVARRTVKVTSLIAALLLIVASGCIAADPVGTVKRIEATPDELRDLSITFERLAFTFPEPVLGRFWIEFQSGGGVLQKHPVPSDAVPASTSFALGYVHISSTQAFLSITTTHDGRADRRTGSTGIAIQGGTRTVTYTPTSDDVPIGPDIELFSAEIKPSWRRPKDPILHFRIMARFSTPK